MKREQIMLEALGVDVSRVRWHELGYDVYHDAHVINAELDSGEVLRAYVPLQTMRRMEIE